MGLKYEAGIRASHLRHQADSPGLESQEMIPQMPMFLFPIKSRENQKCSLCPYVSLKMSQKRKRTGCGSMCGQIRAVDSCQYPRNVGIRHRVEGQSQVQLQIVFFFLFIVTGTSQPGSVAHPRFSGRT